MVVSVLCATSSHSHSAPKPTELTFPISPMSFLSLFVACTDYLPVQKPVKTYSTLCTRTSKLISRTEPIIPFDCVNENACCGELGSISLQSSFSKRKARRFVLTKLVLNRVAELKPRYCIT